MENTKRLEEIVKYVSKNVGVDVSKKSRDREVIYGRALYYKIALKDVVTSLKNIGATVGTNHATVMHSRDKVFHNIEGDNFYMNIYRSYFGLDNLESSFRSVENEVLTTNEKAYRELSEEDRKIYDERAALVLKSFEWKRKDEERKEVFEKIYIGC
tara:strand:+ start:165 stop:632 length:468 start_codon:yes stop_codon:yes gene_type:complete